MTCRYSVARGLAAATLILTIVGLAGTALILTLLRMGAK
jgi:hypothetical protein